MHGRMYVKLFTPMPMSRMLMHEHAHALMRMVAAYLLVQLPQVQQRKRVLGTLEGPERTPSGETPVGWDTLGVQRRSPLVENPVEPGILGEGSLYDGLILVDDNP